MDTWERRTGARGVTSAAEATEGFKRFTWTWREAGRRAPLLAAGRRPEDSQVQAYLGAHGADQLGFELALEQVHDERVVPHLVSLPRLLRYHLHTHTHTLIGVT